MFANAAVTQSQRLWSYAHCTCEEAIDDRGINAAVSILTLPFADSIDHHIVSLHACMLQHEGWLAH